MEMARTTRRKAAIDLSFAIGIFLVCCACISVVNPILRHRHGLSMVLGTATFQLTCEGFALLLVMAFRHESFAEYGLVWRNLRKSIGLALVMAIVYDLGMSWHAGDLLWVPLRRQPAVRESLALGFPLSLVGIAVTVAVWGLMEGFFGVFFARKFNDALGHNGGGWLSPGALGFALFNGLIHLTVGQGFEGFVTSLASGYAIAVIPGVTGNAWGSLLVQTLTNAAGKL
jgi:hypothetical protein